MFQKKITALLVGNHESLMSCIATQLERDSRLSLRDVVGLPEDPTRSPDWPVADIIIMDIDSAESNCFQLATRIRSRWPTTRLILIATAFDDRCIAQALQAGVLALVPKDRLWQLISAAIDDVLAGGAYFPEYVQKRIVIDDGGASLDRELPGLLCDEIARVSDGSLAFGNAG